MDPLISDAMCDTNLAMLGLYHAGLCVAQVGSYCLHGDILTWAGLAGAVSAVEESLVYKAVDLSVSYDGFCV